MLIHWVNIAAQKQHVNTEIKKQKTLIHFYIVAYVIKQLISCNYMVFVN